jgi:hypothetical protein
MIRTFSQFDAPGTCALTGVAFKPGDRYLTLDCYTCDGRGTDPDHDCTCGDAEPCPPCPDCKGTGEEDAED